MEVAINEEICCNPLHPYVKVLLEAVPDVEAPKGELKYIPGSPPDLFRPPLGCRFHLRCPYATEKCRREEPVFVEVGKDHYVACWLAQEA